MREGWRLATVGDVCGVINGGTPKTDVPDYWGGRHNWITPAEMGKRPSPYVDESTRKLTDLGLANSSAQLIPPHSVILSSRAPIGHLVINTRPMATNQGCKGLVPRELLHHKFLFFYLSSIVDHLNELGTGTTFKELSGGKLKEVQLPLPPLSEQKRIVAILDEAFEGIDRAIANTEKNLANARELFNSYISNIFEMGGKSWEKSTIGDEVSLLTGFAFRSQAYTSDVNGVPLLRGDNIVQGKLRWDDVKRWPGSDRAAYCDYEMAEGDIVLAMDRTWIKAGIKFARITRADLPALLVQRVARMRCKQALSNSFLFYLLGSKQFEKYVLDIQTGLGVPHISGGQIQAFRFKRPDLATQQRIVDNMDAMRARCETLVANYERKLTLLNELKSAILQKAFTGELTARSVEDLHEAAQ